MSEECPMVAPPSPAEGAALSKVIDAAWQALLDVDDRTSPADYPDMVLVSRDELALNMALAYSLGAARNAP